MTNVKYLLIGGGLACCEAAAAIRDHDNSGSVLMVGAEKHLPYNRPPLSKALLREEKAPEDILCRPAAFYREKNIKTVLGCHVTRLDVENHLASCSDGREICFEKALLATGGNPVKLKIPGCNLPELLYLRTLDDCLRLREQAQAGRKAVVIGAGFIGMEISASLTLRGVNVTVIEAKEHIWPLFADEKLAAQIRDYYSGKGVTFMTGDRVKEINGTRQVESVTTESGQRISCDFVCCAIGVRPAVELADVAGLTIDNGVVVNEYLETSCPHVWAAGDIANYPDPLFGERRRVEHWGQAEYTGRLAGANMAGTRQAYALLTYAWSDGFDLHYEFAGQEAVHDATVQRGVFGQDNFVMFMMANNRLRAFIAINPGKELPGTLEKLIKNQVNMAGRERILSDPGEDLGKLLSEQ
jgi:3-phenylpropionate/trans-cinnamate dioxygenase ferredoxin reductase subunit